MRTTISIYRQLGKYIELADAEAEARGDGPEDKSIDAHFRSGVYLGVGLSNLILSMMPSKLLTIVELFGYKGDRHAGLEMLVKAGGWSADSTEPAVSAGMSDKLPSVACFNSFVAEEGVRRSLCDMALLMFHLVLSSYTFDGVDVLMAQKILDWNLKRYPNGAYIVIQKLNLLTRCIPRRIFSFWCWTA
jgi:Protein of unknown function (DUF3808)